MNSLNNSKQYRRFVRDRNYALESILHSHQLDIDLILRGLFSQWISICLSAVKSAQSNNLDPINFGGYEDLLLIKRAESRMEVLMPDAIVAITKLVAEMKVQIYQLTAASEAEAIGQATGLVCRYEIPKDLELKARSPHNHSGVLWVRKVLHSISAVKDKLKKVSYQLMLSPDFDESSTLKKLLTALPRTKNLRTKKNQFKTLRITEARRVIDLGPVEMSTGFVSDENWKALVARVVRPAATDPNQFRVIDTQVIDGNEVPYYAWELEKDLNNDMIATVRQAQQDTGEINGVTDFVVIAVLDDVTCEGCCGDYGCVDFDGKLVSEVEKMTRGEYGAPQYHPNCRCEIAPVTSDLSEFTPASNAKEFDEWLNS